MINAFETDQPAFCGTNHALPGVTGPTAPKSGVSLLPIATHVSHGFELLTIGQPRLAGGKTESFKDAFIDAFLSKQLDCFKELSGRFAIALRRQSDSTLFLATDRFATIPIFFAKFEDHYVFAESATLLPEAMRTEQRISQQAVYNYLYFHMIPAPGSIYSNVHKALPASYLVLQHGQPRSGTYWQPAFNEDPRVSFGTQSEALHATLERAISDSAQQNTLGCFLSGGLDSSTVLGFLSKVTDGKARGFTIGFEAEAYDETKFAKAAADHFSARCDVYRMTASDLKSTIHDIAVAYDEPFGNSSALPTLLCARLAKSHGIDTLLAGDGGDELFAGNARYAKQKIFELYYKIPTAIRRHMFDRFGNANSRLKDIVGLRKLHSYVRQSLIPLPDRLETYNYLHHYPLERVFSKRFLSEVDTNEPMRLQRERYAEPVNASPLNRMLYLDWKFTLADNDLRKVTRMCQAADIQVEFPMLEDRLVDFSTEIPSSRKLRGTYLRYFYRKSMRNFLPPIVLEKRKHGFGLPFGVWLVEDPELRSFTYDALSRLEERDYFEPAFISELKTATEQEHAAYYGTMIWVMMMLEIWLSENHRP